MSRRFAVSEVLPCLFVCFLCSFMGFFLQCLGAWRDLAEPFSLMPVPVVGTKTHGGPAPSQWWGSLMFPKVAFWLGIPLSHHRAPTSSAPHSVFEDNTAKFAFDPKSWGAPSACGEPLRIFRPYFQDYFVPPYWNLIGFSYDRRCCCTTLSLIAS